MKGRQEDVNTSEKGELCPKFESAMNLLGKRWVGLILNQMLSGQNRFSEIESSLPISGRLLSERLKELEESGLVERKVFPETPVRIEYVLTEKGQAIKPVMDAVTKWAEEWTQ